MVHIFINSSAAVGRDQRAPVDARQVDWLRITRQRMSAYVADLVHEAEARPDRFCSKPEPVRPSALPPFLRLPTYNGNMDLTDIGVYALREIARGQFLCAQQDAEDFVICFTDQHEAERFREQLGAGEHADIIRQPIRSFCWSRFYLDFQFVHLRDEEALQNASTNENAGRE